MIVEELVANIGLNFSGLGAATNAVKALDGIKAAAFGVGGVMLAASAALTAVSFSVAESVAQMGDFGTAVGASVQNLQALTYAAEQNGGSFDDVSRGLRTLVDAAGSAAGGNAATAKSFAKVGVSVKDANGKLKSADMLMSDVAEGLSKVVDPTARLTAAQDLLGKGAVKLLPAFANGSAGLATLREEAESIGYVLDKETIERFQNLDDAMDNLGARSKGLKNLLGKAFLPFVEKSVSNITRLLEQNTGNISSAFTRIANLVGKPFLLLDLIITGVGDALDSLDAKLNGAKAAIFGVVGAVTILAAIFLLPTVAIIALIAIVALLTEDIYNFATGQNSLIGEVGKSWENFKFQLQDVAKNGGALTGTFARLLQLLIDIGRILGSDLFNGEAGSAVSKLFSNLKDSAAPTGLAEDALDAYKLHKGGLGAAGSFPGLNGRGAFENGVGPVGLNDMRPPGSFESSKTANINISIAAGDVEEAEQKFREVVRQEMVFTGDELVSRHRRVNRSALGSARGAGK